MFRSFKHKKRKVSINQMFLKYQPYKFNRGSVYQVWTVVKSFAVLIYEVILYFNLFWTI